MTWTIVDAQHISKDLPLVLFSWEEGVEDSTDAATKIDPSVKLPSGVAAVCEHARSSGALSAKLGNCEMFAVGGGAQPMRVFVCGSGPRAQWSPLVVERAIAAATNVLKSKRIDAFTLVIPNIWKKYYSDDGVLGVLIAKGVCLGSYTFTRYKSQPEKGQHLKQVSIVAAGARSATELRRGLTEGEVIADAVVRARDWTNMPANDATPRFIAEEATAMAKATPGIRATVMDKAQIRKAGMGGIWGVSRGATEHPTFTILEYWGAAKKIAPIVLCGKAITFDSGGISLKPPEHMEEMKYDMAGGAVVIAALGAIAKLKLKVNVVGLIPATENLPGGEAYKPGDILRTLSGKTIEVLNTDAEGRVILSDALEYAKRYTPALCVDIATLTGAVSIALGNSLTAVVGNDAGAVRAIKAAAEEANEPVWELPLLDEYKEYVKSDIADVKNSSGRNAGVISGAAFLEAFASPMKWAHLDVGGTAYTTESKPWQAKGATGWGVHLFVELARQFAKRKS